MPTFKELYPDGENFCRVFLLPEKYPSAFCFGGGHEVAFTMVDWFNPWPEVLPKDEQPKSWEECKEMLTGFLSKKIYVKAGRQYLVITSFGESFLFTKGQL